MSTPTTSDVQRLKDEGNALFGKKQFKQAIEKYSAALKLDATNAILFANRAACQLGLRKYIDAAQDARKATDLDPAYAKGWARLASAEEELGSWDHAIESWQRAIDALPKNTELSAVDKKQKQLYEENLRKAKATLQRKQEDIQSLVTPVNVSAEGNQMPWQRAQNMKSRLLSSNTMNSSAWVILRAYENWQHGIQRMNNLRQYTQNGQPATTGDLGVIDRLSNALTHDSRVFHIAQEDFVERYNKQAMFEAAARKAWTEGDAKTILNAAVARLRSDAWNSVRPALAVTVRAFIMRAFLSDSLLQDHGAAVTFYTTCIEILEGGMKQWSNVSTQEKGAMFCRSFTRSVKALRLEAFMFAYKTSPKKFPLEKLEDHAVELFADVHGDPYPSGVDPSFLLSFWMYPEGAAAAMSGFCMSERAKRCANREKVIENWTQAGSFYDEASKLYPDDDELKCWFLNSAFDCYKMAGAPLQTLLPLLVTLKECYPKMKEIWEHSQLAMEGRDHMLEEKLGMEREFQRKLADGSLSLSSTL